LRALGAALPAPETCPDPGAPSPGPGAHRPRRVSLGAGTDGFAAEERAHGRAGRQQLQDTLLETEQLEDVLAALGFLKSVPDIDASRLSLMGHSFGGQLTLLAAARDDTVRAAVTFASAAGSWSRSERVRRDLRGPVERARCPIMLVQWANDFSTEASTDVGAVRERSGPPPVVVLYPAVGSTPQDGHSGLYLAVSQWEPDVPSDSRLLSPG
jgi:pimeloyl-ACP methyl ester carboxylesterase